MKRAVWLLALMFLLASSYAWSAPFNMRPVPVNPAPSGEDSLQTIFNNIGLTNYDVYNDQHPAAIFRHTASGNTSSTFIVEFAGMASENEIGIYSYLTGSEVTLFSGNATSGWRAVIHFANDNIAVSLLDADLNLVSYSLYQDFGNVFGFYIKTGQGQIFYSEDSKNNNEAHVLVYKGDGTTHIEDTTYGSSVNGTFNTSDWILAFEDATDFDYNDAVIIVESMEPVPEPATMLLVGAGLLGVGFVGRRRLKK